MSQTILPSDAPLLLPSVEDAGLDARLDTAETDITALEAADVALDGRLDTAETAITSLDGRLDTAETDITSLEGADTALDGRLDSIEAQINRPGYLHHATVRFTADGSFAKASYPGLKAIRVRMVGGGGAGGGAAATGAGEGSFGNGGNGASYAESWILEADLATSEAVTVGQGGAGNSGTTGDTGTDSVFDTVSGEVRAAGGTGGGVAATGASFAVGTPADNGASTGDLTIHGGQNTSGMRGAAGAFGFGGGGGGSMFGAARNIRTNDTNGQTGKLYGGGGTGTFNTPSQAARTGGAGEDGIVIVDVYV